MWLLPAISTLSDLACRVFYRFHLEGPSPPSSGPLMLLANHQNSLFDPAFIASAAERPVRFLAKSTLFNDRRVGWLVRASGAIPVYRTHEVEDAAGKNAVMFESVFDHLDSGHAIGIFPEGTSHSQPSLVQLKTGTARMALGFFARTGSMVPLVPVGLFLRDKGIFRSSALALRGEPVEWGDLAGRGVEDRAAVAELTRRLETALRELTLNLEHWEDRPLVETIEAIWTATRDPASESVERVRRS
ncbi:MAG: 1-acyl-sn-glycerol-3-phosphate acyltransferase, partial [Acidobacteriota bacterium]